MQKYPSPLPGRTRPGLIEAARRFEIFITGPKLFRGVRAPASLKPVPAVAEKAQHEGLFRGVRAPASLKHVVGGHDHPVLRALPGRTRPGLIEAGGSAIANDDRIPSSGAYAPRPH